MSAIYKAWKDKGDNIGIQCVVCGKTHWGSVFPSKDANNVECTNCIAIRDEGKLKSEKELHEQELKDKTSCEHQSSQA